MERIAFIYGETFIYWHSIILSLAATAAVCMFLAFWLGRGESLTGGMTAAALSTAASLVLSRLCHWYFQSAGYESFAAAMTDYSSGGFALMGVFAGCILSACVLRLLRVHRNLPAMLDCMALAGSLGIAVGRLACLYTDSDRGMVLETVTWLPFAYPAVDPVTGESAYRLATFMLQAIWTGAVVLALAVIYLAARKKGRPLRDGDTALLFLALHGAAQIMADSTRYDSLFMRSNGFVGVVQILGAVALAGAIVFFSVYMVRRMKWRWWFAALWAGIAGLLGLAGYMEYYVQRHGNEAAFAYGIMGVSLLCILCITGVIFRLSVDNKGKSGISG